MVGVRSGAVAAALVMELAPPGAATEEEALTLGVFFLRAVWSTVNLMASAAALQYEKRMMKEKCVREVRSESGKAAGNKL